MLKYLLYADPLFPYLPETIELKEIIYPIGKQSPSLIFLANRAEAIVMLAT